MIKLLLSILFICSSCRTLKTYEFYDYSFTSGMHVGFISEGHDLYSGFILLDGEEFYFECIYDSETADEKYFKNASDGNFKKAKEDEIIWFRSFHDNKHQLWIINHDRNCAFLKSSNEKIDNISKYIELVANVRVKYKYENIRITFKHNKIICNDVTFFNVDDLISYLEKHDIKTINVINKETSFLNKREDFFQELINELKDSGLSFKILKN